MQHVERLKCNANTNLKAPHSKWVPHTSAAGVTASPLLASDTQKEEQGRGVATRENSFFTGLMAGGGSCGICGSGCVLVPWCSGEQQEEGSRRREAGNHSGGAAVVGKTGMESRAMVVNK